MTAILLRAMIDTSAFKKGVCLVYKDQPVMITDMSVSTPTARGANTIVKTKLRNLLSGQILNESIRSGEKFEEVDLERHDASYMYNDGSKWFFMDDESFEQFEFEKDALAGADDYLVDGVEGLQAVLIDGHVVNIQLPLAVAMSVVECDPTIKGATAQAQLKPAKTETGLVVQVPPYVEAGEMIKIDTRDAHFIERVKS
ncbi:MAG: elongation factor P [bacterium]|nr:elongation factor P [bacterium]